MGDNDRRDKSVAEIMSEARAAGIALRGFEIDVDGKVTVLVHTAKQTAARDTQKA